MLNHHTYKLLLLIPALLLVSCNKLLEISEPKNSLTTEKVFNNETQASGAMVGVLTQMINVSAYTAFSSGLTSQLGRFSADELDKVVNPSDNFYRNAVTAQNAESNGLWNSAYQFIYGCNGVIEGIAESKSTLLGERVRKELTAEAKFVRAFCYFYLINTFGDVPLVLTTNLAKNTNIKRTPTAEVYVQIISDLKDAASVLPADYSTGKGERIRPNKWTAKALLSRVYLYSGDHANAILEATEVIGQTSLYQLETADLNKVFLKNSSETIWQLQQTTQMDLSGNAVPEAIYVLPNPLHTGVSGDLSANLLRAFDAGDLRRAAWIDSTDFVSGGKTGHARFMYKYKTGAHNKVLNGEASEYYMVLRLAEMYLVRGEARVLSGAISAGIEDVNVLRRRAGVDPLSTALGREQAIAAIARERQAELFGEWGHRWFDLKRTGKAEEVLSAIPAKQPWRGNYQLLYPIPKSELERNNLLVQNPNY
ncbi:RagB/SusD family nutrient uptake outer membrane protein [Pedobacter sp. BAL39]|uniref:RagB/SusD family nutrient uptake outer membrane protein n=1 Tax=Pedobacter sp. BAL39 TaxID=391596 RepID=UPI0003139914|nr:RagB/SusD family nutrient uptake outer membrane protein [Pedobacter sp. BAL39]